MTYITQITNPAIKPEFGKLNTGEHAGTILANIIVTLWNTFLVIGGLAVILFFVLGGIRWLSAGGEKDKVEAARNTLTNALIGMTILFAFFALVNYLGPAIGLDILNPSFTTPDDFSSSGSGTSAIINQLPLT